MSITAYCYEKAGLIFLHIFFAIFLATLLWLLGNEAYAILLILCCQLLLLAAQLAAGYRHTCRTARRLQACLDGIDHAYLLPELLDKPATLLEGVYQEALRRAAKDMADEVARAGRGRREYKEYIEEWIHEIKTPIAAIDLLCHRDEGATAPRVAAELGRVRFLTEQALFYARSDEVEKDYFIRSFALADAVGAALTPHRQELLAASVRPEVETGELWVFSDEKWLAFILSQLIANAIQYRRAEEPRLSIRAVAVGEEVVLTVEDNGVGIPAGDLPRIFEKGFTGSDRTRTAATGIGLYLVDKLAHKLGLTVEAASEQGQYTRFTLRLPADLTRM